MIDNGFQFNWRGMTREPSYPYAQSQDGTAQARAAYIAQQAANMQGYRPLPDMSGYQPTIGGRSVNPDSNPMTQPELEVAGQQQLMDRLESNEARIEELKQEYFALQQEHETATEDLERNVAANRAGIGDTSQYNAWRGRVEAREASKQAREADSEATLRQAKSRLNNALLARSYARGDKEKAAAEQVYKDELAAYNEIARKNGQPEVSESKLTDEKTYTRGDVDELILKHRDKNREWDSEENLKMVMAAAQTLPDADKIAVFKDIFGNTTQAKGEAQRNANRNKLAERKKEADKLVRELVNLRMDDTQRRKFNNRWNAGLDEDIKLIKEFYNYDTKIGAFSPKG